jgi:hypothetical protein
MGVMMRRRRRRRRRRQEAGTSSKKLKKGGQQKIAFHKVAKAAAAHPASTGFVGLLLGMLIMGLKSVGCKRMYTGRGS